METLLEIENTVEKTALNLAQAGALSAFITASTILGISHGKHMEKTVSHMEIPAIYNAVRTSRRVDEQ